MFFLLNLSVVHILIILTFTQYVCAFCAKLLLLIVLGSRHLRPWCGNLTVTVTQTLTWGISPCILVTCTSVLFPEFAQHSAMRAQVLVSLSQHALTPGIHTSFSLVSVRCPVISDFVESFLGGLSKRVFPLLCSPVPSSYPELRTTSDSFLYVYICLLLSLH